MTATLLFAGGGTGGHVFPLLAVAEALGQLAPDVRLVFVGTARGVENQLVPARGFELERLSVSPIRGGGVTGALRGAASAAVSLPRSIRLLRRLRPRSVFSVGGYAAGPVALAARALGVPLAVLEPNADIGLANRWVSRLVGRAYTAFPEAGKFFRSDVVLETGVPLRSGFAARSLPSPNGTLRVLVLGGSQGAKSLNEAVPQALSTLSGSISVVHQAGARHESATRELYARLGLAEQSRVVAFIDDMQGELSRAELVIGRAGASAVSEICAVGRASLLIPYPYAGDHQRHNAHSLERRGACITLLATDATPQHIADRLRELGQNQSLLEGMASAARALGRPDAASVIAQDLLAFSGLSAARASGPDRASAADTLDSGSVDRPFTASQPVQLGEVA